MTVRKCGETPKKKARDVDKSTTDTDVQGLPLLRDKTQPAKSSKKKKKSS